MQWFKDRIKEPSTKKGVALLAALGTMFAGPENVQAAGATVGAVISLWEVVRREW